jgi:hypothetical protein
MTTIFADEIQPGDVLVCEGNPRRIVRIDRRAGWAWPVAVDGSGWAMALGQQPVEVERRAVSTPYSSHRRPIWSDLLLAAVRVARHHGAWRAPTVAAS